MQPETSAPRLMTCFEAYVSNSTLAFFKDNLIALQNFKEANKLIKKVSGINDFFNSQKQATTLLEGIEQQNSVFTETDRREYGDFQTNENLAFKVAKYAFSKAQEFDFVLEPTCGKGNFIIASLQQSESIKKIVGVEVYLPYIWQTKFNILEYFLDYEGTSIPDIDIIHGNAFSFSYKKLAEVTKHLKTLVIGNPPWVTNSELGSINSGNLPGKSNFKKYNGLDAITGKGNFDIGENISVDMLKCFDHHNGIFAFLIKNTVVKNLIQDQKSNNFRIGSSEKLNIDSKKEFNVTVKACLFLTHLNTEPDFSCRELDFYN